MVMRQRFHIILIESHVIWLVGCNNKNNKKRDEHNWWMCNVYEGDERGRKENNMEDTQVGESVRTGDTQVWADTV